MSSPRPAAAAAAAAMFILAAAAAFSVTDGAGCESHPPVLARLCSAQSSRPSSSCCGAVFAAADEGGVTCLCSVHDSPFIIVEGFGSRYFISLYMECGGKLPPGSSIDTICVDSELPPETIAHTRSGAISPASTSPETPPPPRDAASPPPPPASSPPPPPSTGRDVPMVSVAPWYSSHLMTAIKIVGGFLCGCALFYCIHLGGPVGSAARALLNAMISLLWFICGRRRRQTPLPADHIGFRQGDNAPQAAVRASPAHAINRTGEGALTTPLDPPHWIPGHRVRPLGESPPTPRLRPSHQTLDQTSGPSSESPPTPRLRPAHQTPNHGGRPPGGARWR